MSKMNDFLLIKINIYSKSKEISKMYKDTVNNSDLDNIKLNNIPIRTFPDSKSHLIHQKGTRLFITKGYEKLELQHSEVLSYAEELLDTVANAVSDALTDMPLIEVSVSYVKTGKTLNRSIDVKLSDNFAIKQKGEPE